MKCRELAEFLMDYVSGELPGREPLPLRVPPHALPQLPRVPGSVRRLRQGRPHRLRRDERRAPADVPEDLVKAVLAARKLDPSLPHLRHCMHLRVDTLVSSPTLDVSTSS